LCIFGQRKSLPDHHVPHFAAGEHALPCLRPNRGHVKKRVATVGFRASWLLAILVCAASGTSRAQTGAGVIPAIAAGAQYDSTHVYVAPNDVDRFVSSFVATFGGSASQKIVLTVTPTASKALWRFITSPVGTLSVFGFTTPIPYPFGSERTGYLVTDFDAAIRAARGAGADVIVAPYPDPVGRDAVIQWPGGVNMQLYWHTVAPHFASLGTVPENRVYVSADRAGAFVAAFLAFSHGSIVSDDSDAPSIEIGRTSGTYRRIRIVSRFGKMVVLVTDGHLVYPYGRELTGYEVADLSATLEKAEAAGAALLVAPYASDGRSAAMVEFPGGYVAEIHAATTSAATSTGKFTERAIKHRR
jgi:predicted enzyme related to lactoylglutathione lyase